MFAASCGYASPRTHDPSALRVAPLVRQDTGTEQQAGVIKVSLRSSQSSQVGALEQKVLLLVNRERYRAGLKPLHPSSQLAAAARVHNDAMAGHGFFEHRGAGEADLFDRVIASGVDTDHVGENIFETSERGDGEVASQCVKMWMLSDGHRRNLLEPEFDRTGIAIGTSADGMQYITEDFAH